MKICHAVVLCVGVILIAGSLGQRRRDWADDLINTTNSRFREAIELSVKHPLDVGPPFFDEATGAPRFPPPPGFTAEEWDAEVSRLAREDRQREGDRLPGEPTLDDRIRVLYGSRLTTAQLADLVDREYGESTASQPSASDGNSKDDPWEAFNVALWLGWLNIFGWTGYAIWLGVQSWRGARSR